MSDERTEVQVRLVREEPGKHIETTTWLDIKDCPPEGGTVTFHGHLWWVEHRWMMRTTKVGP